MNHVIPSAGFARCSGSGCSVDISLYRRFRAVLDVVDEVEEDAGEGDGSGELRNVAGDCNGLWTA